MEAGAPPRVQKMEVLTPKQLAALNQAKVRALLVRSCE